MGIFLVVSALIEIKIFLMHVVENENDLDAHRPAERGQGGKCPGAWQFAINFVNRPGCSNGTMHMT